jgi:hypothetical protein
MFLFQCPSLYTKPYKKQKLLPYIYIIIVTIYYTSTYRSKIKNNFAEHILIYSIPSSTDRMETVELWISLKHIYVCKDMCRLYPVSLD